MNTIEGNKLIAEFMGERVMVTYKDASGKGWNILVNVEDIDKYEKAFLPYDSDWSWLMKVVKKINRWHIDNYCEKMDFYLFHQSITSSIDMVWDGCVQFIQWYNENKDL